MCVCRRFPFFPFLPLVSGVKVEKREKNEKLEKKEELSKIGGDTLIYSPIISGHGENII